MLKNKVNVLIDGVSTMALVDTGATVSVMSVVFKNLLGRKVMFHWDHSTSFRGVSGDSLYPVGVCNVDVSLGGQTFNTEFTVLPRSTHDVILGIDFLKLCGANVDCRTGELSICGSVLCPLYPRCAFLLFVRLLLVLRSMLQWNRSIETVLRKMCWFRIVWFQLPMDAQGYGR